MTGKRPAAPITDLIPLLRDAFELLNDRPCFALRRDPARTSYALAAAIERFLDDVSIRHDAILSVLPDLTSRIYLAHRDDEQSCEEIAVLLGLPVAEVEARLADTIFALSGIGSVLVSTVSTPHDDPGKGTTMTNAPWIEKLDMLPPDGRTRIRRYIEEGGGASLSTFYRCMLSNDLIGAVVNSDAENCAALPIYVDYLIGYAPENCYGSADKLYGWHGLSSGDR